MKRTTEWLACLLLISGAGAQAVASPVEVTTVPSWNGASSIGALGRAGFTAWGQSVVAPVDVDTLAHFTLYLADGENPTSRLGTPLRPVPVDVRAHVVEFDAASRTLVGPLLYSSATRTIPLTASPVYDPYEFSPGIPVSAGATYLLIAFSTNDAIDIQREDSRARLGRLEFDAYPAGQSATHAPARGDLGSLFNGPWTVVNNDLAFSAIFERIEAVPQPLSEPGPLALLGLGLTGLGFGARRRGRSGPAGA